MTAATDLPPTAPQKTDLILAQLDGLFPPDSLGPLLSGNDEAGLFHAVSEFVDPAGPRAVRGGLDRPGFWTHALAVACAARSISEVAPSSMSAGQAFAAGLFHDIGKLVLDALLPKSYARIVQRTDAERADIAEIERAILGIDHTIAGRRLGLQWNLPPALVECIWLHHQDPAALPASIARGRHVQIVQLADALARIQQLGYSGNHPAPSSAAALAGLIGLPEESLRAVASALAAQVAERIAWIRGEFEAGHAGMNVGHGETGAEGKPSVPGSLPEDAITAALARFHLGVTAHSSIGDVCSRAAEAARRSLGRDAAVVFMAAGPSLQHVGLACDGASAHEVWEHLGPGRKKTDGGDREADQHLAVQSALAGCWIAAPGRSLADLLDRYGSRLGHEPAWLLPIVFQNRWVGGALFKAESAVVADLLPESDSLQTLSTSIGSVLALSQARAEAAALAEELAAANRRLASIQSEAVRRRSLETVVAMAAGAAHELNNPLAVISGRAQVLRDQAENEPIRTQLDTIARQAQAASDIVTELMAFAQPTAPKPQSVSVQETLSEVQAGLAKTGLLAEGDILVDVPSDTPPVWFDPDHLAGVFRDLLENAIEATPPGERRLAVKALPDLTEDFLVVQVSDNGRGMTPEVLARATDPFYSHRPAGRGRGLGLARVSRWLAENDAAMRIASTPGAGTCVTLRLPSRSPASR
jgi:signal transduction histidine kinase